MAKPKKPFYRDKKWKLGGSFGWWHALDEVTYWIPLPEPPEAEKALEAMKDGNG